MIALWSLCLLSSFAVIVGSEIRQKVTLVHRLDERDRLHFIAEAGATRAIFNLKEAPTDERAVLGCALGSIVREVKEMRLGDGKCTVSGEGLGTQPESPETQFGCVDEERKMNINTADRMTLQKLLLIVLNLDIMKAQELAASLVDWRDSDSFLSIPLGSAEDSYYEDLPYPFGAKDANYEVLDEILLVKGMTPEIFERIKGYLTIYGDGRVNVNTAPKAVLVALGLRDDLANMIITFRQGKDGVPGTADDNAFISTSDILPRLVEVYNLGQSERAQIEAVADRFLCTDSRNFMMKSTAGLDTSKGTAEVICVATRNGKILYWREL
jgi:general secretion pathway protein K